MDPVSAAIGAGAAIFLGNQSSNDAQAMSAEQMAFTREENNRAYQRSINMMNLGNTWDMQNQKEMFDYRINQGIDKGMTPYEMFMGPAAGAGGGTTGSGATLGSQPAKLAASSVQASTARLAASTEIQKAKMDMASKVITAGIQANTQKEVAEMQTGATRYSADKSSDASQYSAELQYKMKHKELVLSRERFETVDLPMAAANIGKTEQETKEIINRVATSTPEFVVMMKRLQMGPQNILVEYAINNFGFNPLDKGSVEKASEEQKRNFLGLVLGSQSVAVRELFGASMATGMAVGQAKDTIGNAQKDYLKSWGFDSKGFLNK
jgi:hypothetical protein